MDPSETDWITKNLPDLVKFTKCSVAFLTIFTSKKIFSESDIQTITTKKDELTRSKIFYDLIIQRKNAFSVLLDALDTTCQSGAKEILVKYRVQKLLPTETPQTSIRTLDDVPPFAWNIRAPAPLFTGRKQELNEIHDNLSQNDKTGKVSFKIVAVCGLGGIGKTELVREYIQMHYPSTYKYVVWINSETEAINESFRNLAKDKLNITTRDANQGEKDIKSVVSDVYSRFQNQKCLFVFDNAEKVSSFSDFLPNHYITSAASEYIKVIITSRDTEWSPDAFVLKIVELVSEDAIEFARKGLEVTSPDDIVDVSEMVRELQCFPLAIQQAIAYINQEKQSDGDEYSISLFLEEFKNISYKEMFHKFSPSFSIRDDYEETTYTTWKMTCAKIKTHDDFGELAILIINCMAYMSDNFDRDTFLPLSSGNRKHISRAIRLLLKYAMVNGDLKQNSKFRIHKLVQDVIRTDLEINGRNECILEKVMSLLIHAGVLNGNLEHAIAAWSHARNCDNVRVRFSSFPGVIVEGLIFQERFREALEFGDCNQKKLEADERVSTIDILNLQYQIGVANYKLGNYKEADKIIQNVLSKRKQLCGEKNPDTLNAIHSFACLKLQTGQYEDARDMFRDAFEKKKEVLGIENEKTIDSLHNMGICLYEISQYNDALECYEEAYNLYKKILGENSDAAIDTLQNIAVLNGDSGRAHDAVESLKSLQKVVGEQINNQRKLTIDQNLAFYLLLDGDLDEAFALCEETLDKLIKLGGEDHPVALITKSNLGIILRKKGHYDKAMSMQLSVYKKLANRLEKEHDKALLVKAEIAIIWGYQELFEESRSTLEEIIRIMEERRGMFNHNVVRLKIEFVEILERNEKYEKALDLLETIKLTINEYFGTYHNEFSNVESSIKRIINMLPTRAKRQCAEQK